MSDARPSTSRGKKILFGLIVSLLILAVGVELACQAYAMRVTRAWEQLKSEPRHFVEASPDIALGYQHKRNYDVEVDGRKLHFNKYGARDDSDELPPEGCSAIVMIGDSMTFGYNVSQEQSVPALVQRALDPTREKLRVINLGVSGYELRQMPPHLKSYVPLYRPKHVVYLFNANDFTLLDSVYEGGDNGLYRMYRMPTLKTPWFVRKLIYRWHRGNLGTNDNVRPSTAWYRWIYEGTRSVNMPYFDELQSVAKTNGATFSVVLLPAGGAYRNGAYELADEYADIAKYLAARDIPCDDASSLFLDHVDEIDETDHFTVAGCQRMASHLAAFLREKVGIKPGESAN
ncbi:MAG TPA: GDSL-type esterase/lipase family protein [Phycisphaerales bacterium]|nr:GDSL-type esterase/lipase family protein [Phycisphaerales bacterium]